MRLRSLAAMILCIGLVAIGSDSPAAVVLWDTGGPQQFYDGATLNYWGYSSGSLPESNEPQLNVASPFAITGGSITLTQINADWSDTGDANGGGQLVTYSIYQRTGLNAPGAAVSTGILWELLGTPGVDDTRIPQANTAALHEYAVNIPLPEGNYYLSIASSGAGRDGVDDKVAWLGGANLQPADLEWNGIWRSQYMPSPGFLAWTPTSTNSTITAWADAITPGPNMTDPLNRWNVSFALYGYTTLAWTGTGGNSSWSTAGNWGGTTPSSSDGLEFGPLPSGGSTVNSNNIAAGTQFQAITFLPAAPAYQLSGNSISLGGNVVNLSGSNQTINLALALVASGISFDTGAAGLSVAGAISGSGGITKLGSGELVLSGPNTYSGGTIVADGTLEIASETSLLMGSSLTVGSQAQRVFAEFWHEGVPADGLLEMSGAAADQADNQAAAGQTSMASSVPEPGTAPLVVAAGVAMAGTWLLGRKFGAPIGLRSQGL